jgi:hypothetical protein
MRLDKLLGVVGLTLAASCAVLTVDVDVYKGPMANETDVQAQQLTAMAVAARPLLIQLRDQLEDDHRHARNQLDVKHRESRKLDKLPEELRSTKYIPDQQQLKSPEARIVNAVLGLYLDQLDEAIAPFVGKGNALFEACSTLRERMSRFDEDRKLWSRVDPPKPSESKRKTVYDAFQALLVVDAKLPNPAPSHRDFMAAAKLIDPGVVGANDACVALSKPDKVLAQISLLTEHAQLRRELTERVTEIARAFLEGREKLDEALQLALSFHIAVATRESTFPNQANILRSNARVIALLMQPKTMAAVLANPILRVSIARSVPPHFPDLPAIAKPWLDADYDRANETIASALFADPIEVAADLLKLHRRLRYAKPPVRLTSPTATDITYGLARALTVDEGQRSEIRKAFAQFQSTVAFLGDMGLNGGRLPFGLETMIERYLVARDNEQRSGDDPHESLRERRRLTDGLVHFAEKVLFIVHHDSVVRLAKTDDPPSYVMALQSIGNSILTLVNEEFHRDETENVDALKKKASVLSAALTSAWKVDAERGFRELRDLLSSGEGFNDDLSAELKTARAAVDTAIKERDEALKTAEAATVAARREAVEEAKRKAARWEATAPTTENQKLKTELQVWRNSTGSKSRSEWFKALAELDAVKSSDLEADLTELRRSMTDASAEEAKDAWKALETAIRARVSAAETLAGAKVDVRKDAPKTEADALEAKDKALAAAQVEYDAKRSSSIASSRTALEDSAGRVLARLAASATPTDAQEFRRELVHQLDRDARAKTAADAAPYDIAQDWLEKLPASNAVEAPIISSDAQKPAAVFDQIIASLEQQRTSMTARGVLTQERREQLDRALELAIASRSASIYIRPPWAYLRNATPISAVQDTSVGWQNMVAKHGGRALASNGTGPGDKRVERDIDQQFWQNINRIRVAGMGNTSYVLAKDDIGNWYVKGYSGDPKPVFEGLQAMALAAQSGSMGVDLFKRGDALREAAETGEPVEPGESATLVGKQAQHFEKLYGEDAKKDSKAARDAHVALPKDVRDAWAKLPEWKTEDAAPLTRTRQELEGDLEATLAKLPDAPDAKANAAALSTDVLTVLAKSLDTQEAALAQLDEVKLVGKTELTALEAELSKTKASLEEAQREVELAKARLEAIQALDGALTSDIDKATKALSDQQARANELATSEEQARTKRDAEAERVAAATRLVAGLRGAVLEVVGGGVGRRIDARRASSERYSQAIQVLSSSSSSAD